MVDRIVPANLDEDELHRRNGEYVPADAYDDLRHQLWLLLGDVKARSVSCTCYPPLTKDERYHIERAEALLADYEPEHA